MTKWQELYIKDYKKATEASSLYGKLARDYLDKQGILQKNTLFFCNERNCFTDIVVCCTGNCETDCNYCQSIPEKLTGFIPILIELWNKALRDTRILKKGKTMKKVKKARPVKKSKKVVEKSEVTKEISNGDIQIFSKAMHDFFAPKIEKLGNRLTEIEKTIQANTETLKTYKPILADIKQVIENLAGDEIVETTSKGKRENKQIAKSSKVKQAKKNKINAKSAIAEMFEDTDDIFTIDDIVEHVNEVTGKSAKPDSIAEYCKRSVHHGLDVELTTVTEDNVLFVGNAEYYPDTDDLEQGIQEQYEESED